MAELHVVERASALHYGVEVEDEDGGEVHHRDCLLIRLGTHEVRAGDDLPLPQDAPARPGELLLTCFTAQEAMDLGEAIQSALRAYVAAARAGRSSIASSP